MHATSCVPLSGCIVCTHASVTAAPSPSPLPRHHTRITMFQRTAREQTDAESQRRYQEMLPRHMRALLHMKEYCESQARCRRKQLVEYFGEPFDARLCGGMCDVCAAGTTAQAVDVSREAGMVVEMRAWRRRRQLRLRRLWWWRSW